MKLAALTALLLSGYISDLFARHRAQGDLGIGGIFVGYGVAVFVAVLVFGYSAWRWEADRKRRA